MKLKLIVSSLLALGVMSEYPLAFGAAKDFASATAPADADFPKVGGNLGNQNYSSLKQINKANLQGSGRGVEDAHFSGAHDYAGSGAGRQRHGPANLGARG